MLCPPAAQISTSRGSAGSLRETFGPEQSFSKFVSFHRIKMCQEVAEGLRFSCRGPRFEVHTQ